MLKIAVVSSKGCQVIQVKTVQSLRTGFTPDFSFIYGKSSKRRVYKVAGGGGGGSGQQKGCQYSEGDTRQL